MKNGNFMPSREIGDKMSGCFKKMDFPQGSPESQKQRPDGQTGPGGCKTPEECQKFCGGNPDACKNFQPSPGVMNPGGQTMPQQAGPGGCKTPEECQKFCENNPDNCKNFQQPPTPQEKPCQGDNCQNQIQYRPPEQMQPCQGDNCQNRPPEREFKPLEQGQIQPSTGIMPQNQQQQPQEFQQQPQQQLMPNENPPPPPPPPSAFFKPESFLGALLYPIAKALYNVR
ncbi:MAG: hypothetical protein Q8O66_01940 [bacterium]|nr:hypothetical protein [bacterium]